MQSLASIKELLSSRGLSPRKSLGQNFLIEPAHVARLVEASGVGTGDLVLEVGPGTGVLTDALLERGCVVVACELDRGLCDLLRERYAEQTRRGVFTLVEGDCLSSKHDLNPEITAGLARRPFRLVANLPYNIASPLIVALATRFHPAIRARSASEGTDSGRGASLAGASGSVVPDVCLGQFVTIQREVAERLRASPGTRDYSELSVLVQAMCEMKRLALLPPGCFWPPPKVDSEMVAITPRKEPLTREPERLSALCRMLFTQRRKQIGRTLAKASPGLLDSLPPGVSPTMRAEQLTVEQLVTMSRRVNGGR